LRILVVLFWFFLFFHFNGNAEKTFLLRDKKDADGRGIMYLSDTNRTFSISTIQKAYVDKLFTPFNESSVPNLGQLYYGLWFQFRSACVEPSCLNKNYLIIVDNPQIDSLTLYTLQEQTLISTQVQGLRVPYKSRLISHNSLIYFVKHTQIGMLTHYMYMSGRDTKFLPISIDSHHNFLEEAGKVDMYVALYAGFFLAMILYNLFLFISTREKAFIYYVLYMSSFMLVQLSLQGYVIRILPALSWHTFSITLILLASTCFFALRFSKSFLEIQILSRRLSNFSYVADAMVLTTVMCSITTFFIDTLTPFLNIFILFVILASIIFIISFGIYAYRQGVRAARFFLIAWGILLIGVTFRGLMELNIFPVNIFTLSASQIGSIIEMLLLSMGLADRINQAKIQVNKAQLHTIEVLKQNELTLEKKVKLRTTELQMLNSELHLSLTNLGEEKRKSENLLLNILPEEVATELKLTGEATPKHFEMVTVIFADLVNFTIYASSNQPQEIIEKLDNLFEKFDDICMRHGLEKIKTIGDCYMAAGGLPKPNTTNARDTVNAALEMLRIANECEWDLRIGIHTGSVVAGVVGKHKFAYDIWGDAVNIASRMESSSEQNKINISQATFNLVVPYFTCTARGLVHAKNKGEVDMYYVAGRK